MDMTWKDSYPYTMDKHLIRALDLALNHGDKENADKILAIFNSYRKSYCKTPDEFTAVGQ